VDLQKDAVIIKIVWTDTSFRWSYIVIIYAFMCHDIVANVSLLQQCYLENDHTTMFYAAKALMTLQALYGVIPNLYGKGECAAVCMHYMIQNRIKVCSYNADEMT